MYLDLVSVDLDSTLNCFLHVLCIEVAETEMLDAAVLLQILQGVNVLGVVVLFMGSAMNRRSNDGIQLTNCQWNCNRSILSVRSLWQRSSTFARIASAVTVIGWNTQYFVAAKRESEKALEDRYWP